ncbi:hypothetical protein [uncultured Rhodoblastus sp.]|uniref:hypothetical protein n=1 Tax=uncultured Rhodoblastus sp. TaxID=543037 RepID=UPI0025D9B058|nr:hypothetical protein [uncultured Rhodoblastus sp.]
MASIADKTLVATLNRRADEPSFNMRRLFLPYSSRLPSFRWRCADCGLAGVKPWLSSWSLFPSKRPTTRFGRNMLLKQLAGSGSTNRIARTGTMPAKDSRPGGSIGEFSSLAKIRSGRGLKSAAGSAASGQRPTF